MLSVIIPTSNDERALALTLSVLIPGAVSGLVREVLVADSGSTDMTLEIADGAGCTVVASQAPLGVRLHEAAVSARSTWLMFLRPGTVFESTWLDEVTGFLKEEELAGDCRTAAVFRKSVSVRSRQPMLSEALALIRFSLLQRMDADQGLLIGAGLYKEVGGHRAQAADPEKDLLARLGRRVVMLRSGVRR